MFLSAATSSAAAAAIASAMASVAGVTDSTKIDAMAGVIIFFVCFALIMTSLSTLVVWSIKLVQYIIKNRKEKKC